MLLRWLVCVKVHEKRNRWVASYVLGMLGLLEQFRFRVMGVIRAIKPYLLVFC